MSLASKHKRLCTVCARSGSKGVAGKNGRVVLGRPLIAWTVEQALNCGSFDAVVISSDSDALLQAAAVAGGTLLLKRPAELATDVIGKMPAIVHAAKWAEAETGAKYDTFVDLDVTAPLRSREDISGAIDLLESRNVRSVVTGSPARRSPYFNLVELTVEGAVRLSKPLDRPVLARQQSPRCYDLSGSIYVWQRDAFMSRPTELYDDTLLYVMPEERAFDIDSELDFEIVELLMARAQRKDRTRRP